LKRYEQALAASEQAIDVDHTHCGGWCELGNVQYNTKQWDEASASFQTALDRNPPTEQATHLKEGVLNMQNTIEKLKQLPSTRLKAQGMPASIQAVRACDRALQCRALVRYAERACLGLVPGSLRRGSEQQPRTVLRRGRRGR